jgi:hypothetical protein
MKNKKIIILTLVLSFVFISCNQKEKKQEQEQDYIIQYATEYYPTGEVYKTEKKINEHESEVRFYFKNGHIVQEGIMQDSLAEGQWNNYYNDGVLRGELIFSKGKIVNENIVYPIKLDFKDNPTVFKVGNSYPFRTLGISAFFSIETPKKLGYKRIHVEDYNDVQYLAEITPQEPGDYNITVYIEEIKNDTIIFPITVVE